MKARKIKQDLFIILITSFVLIVCWIGFSIYNSAVSSTIDETLTKQLLPIVPTFDIATIAKLRQRKQTNPTYDLTGIASNEAAITPIPEPTEAVPIQSPTPTNSLLPQSDVFEETVVELLDTDIASAEGALEK